MCAHDEEADLIETRVEHMDGLDVDSQETSNTRWCAQKAEHTPPETRNAHVQHTPFQRHVITRAGGTEDVRARERRRHICGTYRHEHAKDT